jgi:hypothetical protein
MHFEQGGSLFAIEELFKRLGSSSQHKRLPVGIGHSGTPENYLRSSTARDELLWLTMALVAVILAAFRRNSRTMSRKFAIHRTHRANCKLLRLFHQLSGIGRFVHDEQRLGKLGATK